MTVSSKWKCNHFSIAQSQDRVPTLLRKVAAEIQKLQPCDVFDIVVRFDGEHMVATVYYDRSRKKSRAAMRQRPRRSTTGAQ
jgi:hypothetical protein